jgi:hypothetical protein
MERQTQTITWTQDVTINKGTDEGFGYPLTCPMS